MSSLGKNWITEKHIDFEYKKYLVLGYLQSVSKRFEAYKLYPPLAELIEHHKQLIAIRENTKSLFDSFPSELERIDKKNLELVYKNLMDNDHLIQELESIIEYSIPKFEQYLSDGQTIYDEIEDKMTINPIGIVPLNPMEGYLLMRNGEKETKAYEYRITVFEKPDVKYRGIRTKYIKSFTSSITVTPESIKSTLIRENEKLPNPATYIIETQVRVPFAETFLPIAKRSLVKFVASEN